MVTMNDRLLYKGYWQEQKVEIIDNGLFRSLYFGSRLLQSRMSLIAPHELVLSYTCYMLFTLLINPIPQNILIVGIGAGSFVRFFHHHFSKCQIDAVDLSPDIINAARGYFQFPENDNISIYCADGLDFLQTNCRNQYDLILVDAFDDQGMSPTVYSSQFFSLCANSLCPGGSLSCNLWSNDESRLQEIKKNLADHYTGCLYLPVPDRGNIVAIALPFTVPWSRILSKKNEIASLKKRYNINFQQLIKVARRNNLNLSERMIAWLR